MDEASQGFIKHNGGLSFKKVDETNYEFEAKIEDMHLNTGKIAHGGFLSTIADAGMGTAAHQVAGNKRCVTISLEIKFISVALSGEILKGKVKILKKTKSLVFINCEIKNQKTIITSSSGVWKILKT